jgi:serine/threonine-protein phosphatase 2B catalytic subunit
MHRWNGLSNFPNVITVFSAPNYCGSYSNSAAVIIVDGEERLQIKQFREVESPF